MTFFDMLNQGRSSVTNGIEDQQIIWLLALPYIFNKNLSQANNEASWVLIEEKS